MPNRIPTPSVPTPKVRSSKIAQAPASNQWEQTMKQGPVNIPAKKKPLTGNAAMNANINKLTPAGVKADTARQNAAIAGAHKKSGYGK